MFTENMPVPWFCFVSDTFDQDCVRAFFHEASISTRCFILLSTMDSMSSDTVGNGDGGVNNFVVFGVANLSWGFNSSVLANFLGTELHTGAETATGETAPYP